MRFPFFTHEYPMPIIPIEHQNVIKERIIPVSPIKEEEIKQYLKLTK